MKNKILIFCFSVPFLFSAQEETKVSSEPGTIDAKIESDIYDGYIPAEYPGGMGEMKIFIAQNLVFPKIASENGIQGKCYIKFTVNTEGEVGNVQVIRGVQGCPECDKEAIRVVKLMPKWKPAVDDGKNVNSVFNLPITFKLTDTKKD